MVAFSNQARIHQDFTGDPELVIHALRMARKEGGGAHMPDRLRPSFA